jgi:hypothetical protein
VARSREVLGWNIREAEGRRIRRPKKDKWLSDKVMVDVIYFQAKLNIPGNFGFQKADILITAT